MAKKKKKTKKKKRDDKRVDMDVRPYPNPFFRNHDYGADPSEPGPGPGLYQGKMDKYKSVSEFRKEKEKRKKRRLDRLDAWNYLLGILKEAGVEV